MLPNDRDSVRVAEAAAQHRPAGARAPGRVVVIPTKAQVQGLAALAVHEPGRAFDQDVLEMTAAARHARHGAVTVAAKQAMTMAGPCEPGDVLGVDRRRLRGRRRRPRSTVATDVLERLLGGGGELVTVVGGPRTATTWPARVLGVPRARTTRRSTSSCTTAGRTATRCSSASSRG